jgi:hypothetical protein
MHSAGTHFSVPLYDKNASFPHIKLLAKPAKQSFGKSAQPGFVVLCQRWQSFFQMAEMLR